MVVQLVRIPACHAGGRGFESRPLRQSRVGKGAAVRYAAFAAIAPDSLRSRGLTEFNHRFDDSEHRFLVSLAPPLVRESGTRLQQVFCGLDSACAVAHSGMQEIKCRLPSAKRFPDTTPHPFHYLPFERARGFHRGVRLARVRRRGPQAFGVVSRRPR